MSALEVSGVSPLVYQRLRSIYDVANDLNERDVLADARDESSPLHAYFEWDDTAAAERYRLAQAQDLIRRVKVTVVRANESPVSVRAFIAKRELTSVGEPASAVGSYAAIEHVAGVTAYEVSIRESISRDLAQLQRKYRDTELLFEMAADVFGGDPKQKAS